MRLLALTLVMSFLSIGTALATDTVGVVDPDTGVWRLRTEEGHTATFFFGNPGDAPVMGDWNCDGIDTPGLYRRSDGYAYLRNTNTQGTANVRFFFGNPQDVPLAGDFDGDGCDTLSIYRPSEGRVYVINELGDDDAGLGQADHAYYFGNPGDQPFVADFDGDRIDTVGLHRESTGFVYYRDSNTEGAADNQFFYGDPGDRLFAGDWTDNGIDTVGLFRPGDATIYLRHENSQGVADEAITYGRPTYLPIAGRFGQLDAVAPSDCTILPADNIWNTPIDDLPVHPRSGQYVAAVGAGSSFHADFGSGVWPPNSTSPIGIPYVEVPGDQSLVEVTWTAYGNESDPGPYPIPPDAPIEGGPDATGDRHVLVLDTDHCMLYELFSAFPQGDGAGGPPTEPSMTSGRTCCDRTAGPRQMPPDCRSCPDSSATRRLPPAASTTPFGSLPRRRSGRMYGPPVTSRRASPIRAFRPWGSVFVSRRAMTRAGSPRRPGSSSRR